MNMMKYNEHIPPLIEKDKEESQIMVKYVEGDE